MREELMNGVIAIYDAIKRIGELEGTVAQLEGENDVLKHKLADERRANEEHRIENARMRQELLQRPPMWRSPQKEPMYPAAPLTIPETAQPMLPAPWVPPTYAAADAE